MIADCKAWYHMYVYKMYKMNTQKKKPNSWYFKNLSLLWRFDTKPIDRLKLLSNGLFHLGIADCFFPSLLSRSLRFHRVIGTGKYSKHKLHEIYKTNTHVHNKQQQNQKERNGKKEEEHRSIDEWMSAWVRICSRARCVCVFYYYCAF